MIHSETLSSHYIIRYRIDTNDIALQDWIVSVIAQIARNFAWLAFSKSKVPISLRLHNLGSTRYINHQRSVYANWKR